MNESARGRVAYIVLFCTCIAAALHLSWWAACAGASVLTVVSLSGHQAAAARYGTFDASANIPIIASSILNASAACAVNFGFGCGLGWLWGF